MQRNWIDGSLDTPAGPVTRVKTDLSLRDRAGGWRVRWGIGRMGFRVPPGIYAAGHPSADSMVLVTANYKMSFDRLRENLAGRDAWILVLDTKGVNVWCAAGKGTFGTEELVRRIDETGLSAVVSHRRLILPQLGATGVSAHEVANSSGWKVVFGPVRAEDLPAFIDAGMKAASGMRLVRFGFSDRMVLVPVELVGTVKYLLIAAAIFILLSGLGDGGYSLRNMRIALPPALGALLAAYIAGAALTPALLPWIPGRAFSAKGAVVGIFAIAALLLPGWKDTGIFIGRIDALGWLLAGPAVSSYLAMGFTGASTYTSQSGVRREMRIAVPAQIAAAAAGLAVWIIARFV